MRIGYARVSTQDQSLDLQLDALKAAGCGKIFTDKISGAKSERPGLTELVSFAREGDQIVVWKLDRLGRSMRQLVNLVNDLHDRGIEIFITQGGIDTTTSTGRLMFNIFGSFAELERELIQERTLAGLDAARARGRSGGRPVSLSEKKAEEIAEIVKASPSKRPAYWCEIYGISRSTYYRMVKPLIK